jgi:hypothetical protein
MSGTLIFVARGDLTADQWPAFFSWALEHCPSRTVTKGGRGTRLVSGG